MCQDVQQTTRHHHGMSIHLRIHMNASCKTSARAVVALHAATLAMPVGALPLLYTTQRRNNPRRQSQVSIRCSCAKKVGSRKSALAFTMHLLRTNTPIEVSCGSRKSGDATKPSGHCRCHTFAAHNLYRGSRAFTTSRRSAITF